MNHTIRLVGDVVKEVIKGNSINQVSINRNIPIKSIVDWVNLYRQKGIKRNTYKPKEDTKTDAKIRFKSISGKEF